MATDTPKNVLNVKALDLEGDSEPVRVPTRTGSGFITFPAFIDKDAEDVEEMFDLIDQGLSTGKLTPLLKKWLTEREYEKFRKSYPKWQEQMTIVNAVVEKFQAMVGDRGEGDASAS